MPSVWQTETAQGLLAENARDHPDKPALVFENDRTETFAEVHRKATTQAASLRELGVGPSDTVAPLLSTFPEFVHLFYGTLQVGSTINPLNIMWGTSELSQVLERTDPTVVVTMDRFGGKAYLEMVEDVLELEADGEEVDSPTVPSLDHLVTFAPDGQSPDRYTGWADFEALGGTEASVPSVEASPSDNQFIIQTSGTSGLSKSVLQDHVSLVGNAHFVHKSIQYEHGEEMMNISPFYHCAGITMSIILNLSYMGNTLFIQEQFEPSGALETIQANDIVATAGFPTALTAIGELDEFESESFPIRKAILALSPSKYEKITEMLGAPEDELFIANTFGQTESGPLVTVVPPEISEPRLRKTWGLVLPGLEICIKGETGEIKPEGEVGEICYRGWSLTDGYYDQEPLFEEKVDEDGFFHSGDLGRFEYGYLHYVGRDDDVVKSGGENVPRREVQEFLASSVEGIADARVIGIPDEYWGQRVVAFVELESGTEMLPTEEWRDRCRGRISDYKIPKNFLRHDGEWPTTTTGKLEVEELERIAKARIVS